MVSEILIDKRFILWALILSKANIVIRRHSVVNFLASKPFEFYHKGMNNPVTRQ